MKLPELALRNYRFSLVVTFLLLAMGVTSFLTMPRSEDPTASFAGAIIVVAYPGVGPADMERLVVDPVEEAINELDDVHEVNTTIQDGLMWTFVRFMVGTDPDDKYSKVMDAVAGISDKLPDDLALLEISQQDVSLVNIVQYALVSETAEFRTLERLARRLERRLERVPGIRQSDTWAYPAQRVEINVDLEKMREVGLSLGQVMQAVQASATNIPGGQVDSGTRRFNVRTSGDYESLEDIRRTVVHTHGGRIVYLQDVAQVEMGYAEPTHIARHDGRRAVFVTAIQRPNTNIFDVVNGVRAVVRDFESTLPADVVLETAFDQSLSVASRVNHFFSNLLQGLFLVGLVVLMAFGFRAAGVVILAIPLSIFIAIGWLDLSGYGIQQMSIVGLVIALGLLVDNAIVVTDNVLRFMREGFAPMEAAVRGTKQIASAVVSSTVTTLLAFLPMIILPTETGTFIRSMPLTVVFALVASLLVSLAVTPYLTARFLGGTAGARTPREGFGAAILRKQIEGPYGRSLRYAVSHPGVVSIASFVFFIAALGIFPLVGVSLFPKAEKTQFMILAETPEGTSLTETNTVVRHIESVIASHEEVVSYTTNVGRGNPYIYYNFSPKRETSTNAEILAVLPDTDPARRARVVAELRTSLEGVPGARIEVLEFQQGPRYEAPIAIKIFGDNIDVLRSYAAQLEQLVARTPGTVNVDNTAGKTKTDLHVAIDRDKAGLLGVPLVEIDRTVRAALAGIPVAKYRDAEGDEYDLTVRLPVSGTPAISDFDRISVTSVTGARIPLRQLATIEFRSGPSRIEHQNFGRNAMVSADVRDGFNIAAVTNEIVRQLDSVPLPPGYSYSIGGEQAARSESFGGMGQALIAALLGIFAVLVLQFGSFKQALIVLAAIPFSITGAVVTLLITGHTFSFTAFVGLTSLIGIVINNSIILVDYANQLRAEGKTTLEAILLAGERRFTPIVLTTLTTVGGLLPLTLTGGSLFAPFGWTIIGGLLASTFLTMLVVPTLYRALTPEGPANAA